MFVENQRSKQKALEDLERQRQEDIKAQEAYAKMLEKQEELRMKEIKAREERQQAFMNHMADTVIKDKDAKAQEEETKIKQYEQQREMKLKAEEERRAKRLSDSTKECRDFLFKQIEAKRKQELREREEFDEQAKIWEVDRINSLNQEKRQRERQEKLNKDTAAILKQQITERMNKVFKYKMNRTELQFNKGVLRTVNDKLREYDQQAAGETQKTDQQGDPSNGNSAEQT